MVAELTFGSNYKQHCFLHELFHSQRNRESYEPLGQRYDLTIFVVILSNKKKIKTYLVNSSFFGYSKQFLMALLQYLKKKCCTLKILLYYYFLCRRGKENGSNPMWINMGGCENRFLKTEGRRHSAR